MRGSGLLVILWFAVLQVCACSFVGANSVPDDYEISQELECTSYAFPSTDLGLGLGLAAGSATVFALGVGDNDDGAFGSQTANITGGALGAVAAAFFLGVAVTGYSWTYNCRWTEDLHEEWRIEASDEGKQEIERRWKGEGTQGDEDP